MSSQLLIETVIILIRR